MSENEKRLLSNILLSISNSIHGTEIEKLSKEENKKRENEVREAKIELDDWIRELTGF